MTLLESTQKLLSERLNAGVTKPEIAEALGGKPSREWLYKFSAGSIRNPGISHLEKLRDCLAKIKPKHDA